MPGYGEDIGSIELCIVLRVAAAGPRSAGGEADYPWPPLIESHLQYRLLGGAFDIGIVGLLGSVLGLN